MRTKGDTEGYNEENDSAVRHGGAGAIRRIAEKQPFIGIAADEQKAVEADLQLNGTDKITELNCIRLQTAMNLYWNAVQKSAADGDLESFDRYISRFGWLAGVTMRAWAQYNADAKAKSRGNIIDLLKGGNDGEK